MNELLQSEITTIDPSDLAKIIINIILLCILKMILILNSPNNAFSTGHIIFHSVEF